MIRRTSILNSLDDAPAREIPAKDSVNYLDLEDPAGLARLDEPTAALRPLTGLEVIDPFFKTYPQRALRVVS